MMQHSKITRREFMKFVSVGAASLLATNGCTTNAPKPTNPTPISQSRIRPNVILIMADDLGYSDLGAYGNEIVHTPVLDQMVVEGIKFTQHYSASPICTPTRASLLTGRYPQRTGAYDVSSNRGVDRIRLSEKTIADTLKDEGYVTGMVGKWHNGLYDMRYHPNARGFDEFAGFLNGGMDYWEWAMDYNGQPQLADGRHLTDVLTQEAVHFIDRHKQEAFFLYLAYNAPHVPIQPHDDYLRFYEAQADLSPEVKGVYALISQMDKGIGDMLQAIRDYGIEEQTIVVFISDNGAQLRAPSELERFNGALRDGKWSVFEGGIRTPAIVRWQRNLNPGIVLPNLAHTNDWLPTLVEATGIPIPADTQWDGQSLLPLLRQETTESKTKEFWQWNRYLPVPDCNAAMRDGQWKLYIPPIPEAMVKDASDDPPYQRGLTEPHWLMDINPTLPERILSAPRLPQLFDLESDPSETTDVAAQYPERVSQMHGELHQWFNDITTQIL